MCGLVGVFDGHGEVGPEALADLEELAAVFARQRNLERRFLLQLLEKFEILQALCRRRDRVGERAGEGPLVAAKRVPLRRDGVPQRPLLRLRLTPGAGVGVELHRSLDRRLDAARDPLEAPSHVDAQAARQGLQELLSFDGRAAGRPAPRINQAGDVSECVSILELLGRAKFGAAEVRPRPLAVQIEGDEAPEAVFARDGGHRAFLFFLALGGRAARVSTGDRWRR